MTYKCLLVSYMRPNICSLNMNSSFHISSVYYLSIFAEYLIFLDSNISFIISTFWNNFKIYVKLIIKICKGGLHKCRNVAFLGGKTCHQKSVHRISRLICTFSALLIKISVCVFLCVYVLHHFCRVWFCATLWPVAYQAHLSVGFFRQEYCSGLPWPPREHPDPGFKPTSLTCCALAGGFFTTSTT